VNVVVDVVVEHEVPAVEAVLAAVGHHVAGEPHTVLARWGDEERPTAAVDAHDLGARFQHRRSLPRVRVVAGELRGRRIVAPAGSTTRPTTDKVREAVFNALGSLDLVVGAGVADLYAGSGAMGIEALSRGAARCTFVERDRDALRALRTNIDALELADRARVTGGDVMAVAAALDADLVFVDPPYDFTAWDRLLAMVRAPFLVAESGAALDDAVVTGAGWEVTRAKRYGRTWVTFMRPAVD
jgi:16S rRNA (guanine966-N2)-methyltransferase